MRAYVRQPVATGTAAFGLFMERASRPMPKAAVVASTDSLAAGLRRRLGQLGGRATTVAANLGIDFSAGRPRSRTASQRFSRGPADFSMFRFENFSSQSNQMNDAIGKDDATTQLLLWRLR